MRKTLLALAMAVMVTDQAAAQDAVCRGGWVLVMASGEKDFPRDAWMTFRVEDIMRLHHWPRHDRYEITIKPVQGQGGNRRIGVLDRSSYTTILNCLLNTEG